MLNRVYRFRRYWFMLSLSEKVLGLMAKKLAAPFLTVCRATETAFETHSATINSLRFNKLRSVAAFTPIFSPAIGRAEILWRQYFLSALEAATLHPLYLCGL